MDHYKLFVILISCIMLPSAKTTEESKIELLSSLNQTFAALGRLLIFFQQDIDKANLDAIYGIRASQGTLKRLLARRYPVDMRLINNSTSLRVNNAYIGQQLVMFHKQLNTLANNAQIFIQRQDKFYYNRFKFVVDKPWGYGVEFGKRQLPWSALHQIRNSSDRNNITHKWNERISDKCMAEVIGSNKLHKKCLLSKTCAVAMSDPYIVGYGPTHQILFLTLAHIRNCEKNYSEIFKRLVGLDVDKLIENRCVKILHEMLEIERQGVPTTRHDLYFEQIFVCAMNGYEEFLSVERLKKFLSWQLYPGCFGNVSSSEDDDEEMKRRRRAVGMSSMRRLLVDAELDYGCSSHESGVAVGLLGMYIKWLLYKIETLAQPSGETMTERIDAEMNETSEWNIEKNKESNGNNVLRTTATIKAVTTKIIHIRKNEANLKKHNKYSTTWVGRQNKSGHYSDYPLFLTILVSFLTTIVTLIAICTIYKLIFHCIQRSRSRNSYKKLLHSDDDSYMA